MTTNTTSKAAAVTIDTPEFRDLLRSLHACPAETLEIDIDETIASIDAKLAQARDVGCTELRRQDHAQACRVTHALMAERDEYKARAIAAEKALEAVRRGVECSAETLECLGDIFSNTERPDKITVRIDDATNSLHVHYEDLDEEWLREVKEAIAAE